MTSDSCGVGKGAVHTHDVTTGEAQHRAHQGRIGAG
jgi:hypothetical protein